ncbi:MAG: phage scaffolding protein, partial [Christensenellaceae bacterium]
EEWKQKAEQAEKDSAAKIAEMQFSHALEGKLAGAKAKDASLLAGLLKKDDLKLTEDGNILGLDEQIAKIKEEKDYLFEPDDKTPQFVKSTNNGSGVPAADSTLRAAMGLPPLTEK